MESVQRYIRSKGDRNRFIPKAQGLAEKGYVGAYKTPAIELLDSNLSGNVVDLRVHS